MEKMRATLVDREQVIARWQETIEEQKSMVNQAYERVQNFGQQIDVARRSVGEMQEFKDLILREQSQVQELQRLAEERIRRDMDEFREDFEKRRRKADLRQEHLWSEQDKYNREVVETFPAHHARPQDPRGAGAAALETAGNVRQLLPDDGAILAGGHADVSQEPRRADAQHGRRMAATADATPSCMPARWVNGERPASLRVSLLEQQNGNSRS